MAGTIVTPSPVRDTLNGNCASFCALQWPNCPVALLNPSAIAFYLTVLPSYLPPGGGGRAFAELAAIHITLALTCHTLWAAGFSRIGALIGGPHTVRRLDVFAGAALVALGVWSLAS